MKLSKIYTSLYKQLRNKGETPNETFLRRSDIMVCDFLANIPIGVLSLDALMYTTTLKTPDLQSVDIGSDIVLDISRAKITGDLELVSGEEVYTTQLRIIAITHTKVLIEIPTPKEGTITGSFVDGSRTYTVCPLDDLVDNTNQWMFLFWFYNNFEIFDLAKKSMHEEGRTWDTLIPTKKIKKDNTVPLEWLVSGHFRHQPYGKGREQNKLIFIGPQRRKRHTQ